MDDSTVIVTCQDCDQPIRLTISAEPECDRDGTLILQGDELLRALDIHGRQHE